MFIIANYNWEYCGWRQRHFNIEKERERLEKEVRESQIRIQTKPD